jgi:hypothetical protein
MFEPFGKLISVNVANTNSKKVSEPDQPYRQHARY